MSRTWWSCLALVLVAGSAAAAPSPSSSVEALLKGIVAGDVQRAEPSLPPPVFASIERGVSKTADDHDAALTHLGAMNALVSKSVIGIAADGHGAWAAADMELVGDCGGPGCGRHLGWMHALLIFDDAAPGWHPIAFSAASTQPAKVQARRAKTDPLDDVPSKIDAGAEAAAKLFSATLGDPKALAASVSDRKDVVLYGTEDGDRVVGGAQVKAKLVAWNLRFTVTSGVRAGLVKSGKLAWVAANVTTPALPYRALFVYEQQGAGWKLVAANFTYGD